MSAGEALRRLNIFRSRRIDLSQFRSKSIVQLVQSIICSVERISALTITFVYIRSSHFGHSYKR